ncbi:MAG: N-acetylmuramoyl-L-alanine amidase [Anaerolineae bacterium]|nr:MAG: N-acetylmuramoyl-L-alanine amidase [Anaerolineae bacterium]
MTNEQSVGVALAGNFTDQAPPAEQLASAAALIAWLLYSLHLPIDALVGRKEIETSHGSPGKQWMQGANYKATLVRQVQAILDAAIEVEPRAVPMWSSCRPVCVSWKRRWPACSHWPIRQPPWPSRCKICATA